MDDVKIVVAEIWVVTPDPVHIVRPEEEFYTFQTKLIVQPFTALKNTFQRENYAIHEELVITKQQQQELGDLEKRIDKITLDLESLKSINVQAQFLGDCVVDIGEASGQVTGQ